MIAISLFSDEENKRVFGSLPPGFKLIPYGNVEVLKNAITARFLVEPILRKERCKTP